MRNYFYSALLLSCMLPLCVQAALININTADVTLLDTLPGIGPSKAAAIMDYRAVHGPFAKIEDIQNVKGIGPSTYAGLAPLITVAAVSAEGAVSEKPSVPPQSSNEKQTVTREAAPDAKSISVSAPAHENTTVGAPGTTSQLAAPGALVADALAAGETVQQTRASSIFSSPWTLGFLGMLVVAGGVLMIL